MNKTGIIYLFISITVVLGTALFVLMPEKSHSNDELTITVMNTTAVISVQTTETLQITQTTKNTMPEKRTSFSTEKITTTMSATTLSSFLPNTETMTTTSEVPEPVMEQETEEIFIDINFADVQELMKLDGIGEATANEIIRYREQNGGFLNIEEIMEVSGIGEAKFANIRDFIYVQNPVYYVEEVPEEVPEPETETEIFLEEEPEKEITLADIAPININTASIEELILLPNVNEQIAQDIITFRESIGGFSHVYELLYIEKLEQKQVAELEEFVTVGQ